MTIREELEQREAKDLSPYACLAKDSKGREREIEPCPLRTCFQRDIDRVVHCKAFRRLKHKTQVFLCPEGDHYRTRMTHTLEVNRVARTICRGLGLNEDLAEAAALGHDLGHTPFGHAGERILNDIMADGFRHNEQSLRVVDRLENNGQGLNLTYEVRRGIVCHSSGEMAETLEGQVVRFADKIAYLSADIDDALRGGVLYPLDIPAELVQILGSTHSERLNSFITDIITESQGKGKILQSDRMRQAQADLNTFMFSSVYLNSIAKTEETKAQELIYRLFEYYVKHPDLLGDEYRDIWEKEGRERAVCDYIAGMTDAYAVETYQDLFIPKSWAVK
ncbi:MAG: deoxyguanosinetriphosphate triphosphohydrolase [Oscillospiraceae bacterium]|nr:deoxyguanosinetriphosphate triphosphohydrolase [Oscillospiraceae bacterium]